MSKARKIGEFKRMALYVNGTDEILDSRLCPFFELSVAEFNKFLELSGQCDDFKMTEDEKREFEKLLEHSEINCVRFQGFLKRKGLLEKYSPQLKKICGKEKEEKVRSIPLLAVEVG